MVKQYPHSISFNWNSPATQDEQSGNMVAGGANLVITDCRAEPNGSGKTIPSQDGTLVSYSYTVYVPGQIRFIPTGAKATLTIAEQVLQATVKSSHVGSFNSRVWL